LTTNIGRVGYWSGLAAFASTLAYDVVQLLQLVGVLRFPADEILIYGTSLCIVVPFTLEMLAFDHLAPPGKRFWTHASVIFTSVYAVFVTANYVVQLATVIPAKLANTSEAIRLLEQTPHSLFWDYDAVGYVSMGLASLFAVPAVGRVGFDRWVRRALVANTLVTPLISIVYFYPTFSTRLLFLGLPWAITAPLFMLMLAIKLGRTREEGAPPARPHREAHVAEGGGSLTSPPTPFTFHPIGVVRSPYTESGQIPKGTGAKHEAEGVLELNADLEPGLTDIDGFSHLFVLWVFDRSTDWDLMAHPPIDERRPHGVFATRSPRRPNAIALTVVQLLRREGSRLHVRGVDMLDGSPILDIKPYLSSVPAEELRRGWVAEAEARGGGQIPGN
jgi:tRNA-Thr(GGU) m(6)t(6)A37 methyltransferase TsaA